MKNPRLSAMTERSVDQVRKVASWYTLKSWREHKWGWRIALIVGTVCVLNGLVMFWWSREPAQFDVAKMQQEYLPRETSAVTGSAVVGTTANILQVLLHKPGGYMLNDIAPPSVFMDNITEWELGVVVNLRETIRSLRYEFSRAQSQSQAVAVLEEADNAMSRDANKWATIPTPESSFSDAQEKLIAYGKEIANPNQQEVQFYARADNLVTYLDMVSKTLGDYTQTLSNSVGETIVNSDMMSTDSAQSTASPEIRNKKTPRLKVDNYFYRARGYSWALLHELQAIRIDFKSVLEKKNALATLDQIIHQLESSQKPVWSPMILNGRGFGFSANHSLVIAGYLGRANAGIIDLVRLLKQG